MSCQAPRDHQRPDERSSVSSRFCLQSPVHWTRPHAGLHVVHTEYTVNNSHKSMLFISTVGCVMDWKHCVNLQPPADASTQDTMMAVLVEMGFGDRPLNQRLLNKYNYNLLDVVNELVQMTDNDWYSTRYWQGRGGDVCGWMGGWKDRKYSSRNSVWRKKRENPLVLICLFTFLALIGLIGNIPVCDHMRRLFRKTRMLYESIIHCLSYYYGFWFDSCRATALHRGWRKM